MLTRNTITRLALSAFTFLTLCLFCPNVFAQALGEPQQGAPKGSRSNINNNKEVAAAQQPCCSWTMDLSTGQGSGSIDPLWKVNGGNAYKISNLSALAGVWTTMPPAKWIQPSNASTPDEVNPGNYTYTMDFTVPNCPGSHVTLTGSFRSDDTGKAYLDGKPIPGVSCASACFGSSQPAVSLNGAPVVTPGPHTLKIEVKNAGSSVILPGWTNTSPSGLIVNARLMRSCP